MDDNKHVDMARALIAGGGGIELNLVATVALLAEVLERCSGLSAGMEAAEAVDAVIPDVGVVHLFRALLATSGSPDGGGSDNVIPFLRRSAA